ncbi:MAG: hypothetical protein ACP5DQ_01515 [Bacteroidales bacterium]
MLFWFSPSFHYQLVQSHVSDDDEKNPVDCAQLLTTYSEAYSAYVFYPENMDKCNTLKNAIEDYLNSDCPALTPENRDALQQELEALPCY